MYLPDQLEKKNKFISYLFVVMISMALALWIENCSVIVFAILSWSIILMVDSVVFRNYKKNTSILLFIWCIYIACIIWVYCAQIKTYGVPYVLSDDYYMETEWVKECLDKKFYTISQMKEGSDFFSYANCNAYILFFAYLNRFGAFCGGYHTMDGRIVNATASIISGILISGICKKSIIKNSDDNPKGLLLLSTLLPNIVFLSAHIYRDCYVTLLLVWIFYIWNSENMKKKHMLLFILTIIDFYLLYWNREFSVVYGLVIVYVALFFSEFEKKVIDKKYSLWQLIGVTVALVGIVFFLIWLFSSYAFNHYINAYKLINTENGGLSGYVYGISILPFGWILRLVFYLCSPMYPQIFLSVQFGTSMDLFYALISLGTCFLFFVYPFYLVVF